jgi:rhodanese-related sulfurtransferase
MKKAISVAVLTVAVFVSGAAAFQAEDISSPKLRIAWDEFKKLYDKNEAVVVDVRSADAYELGHIPNSRSIPLDQVGHRVDELKALKKTIVFYCA